MPLKGMPTARRHAITSEEIELSPLEVKGLDSIIENLPKMGEVKYNDDSGFAYLDVDDNYIHYIYPLLKNSLLIKPDYFSEKTNFIGAHISFIYPEEGVNITPSEENKLVTFEIEGLFLAELLNKKYYVLKINSPKLLELRYKYGLSTKLKLYNHLVDLHITIAVH